jgi:hypothetical protein
MEKQTYNDQTIVQYLLGSLPEEETERFDELSFIDDEFAERLDAVETDLVDAYVKGELSGQALGRFDSYYLASPKRREKVGFAQALKTVAERVAATRQTTIEREPPPAPVASDKPSWWTSLLDFFTLPRLALAAAAMLTLAAGGWMVFEVLRLRGQVDQAQARHRALEQREKDLREKLEQQQRASSTMEKELEQVREEKDRLERQMALDGQLAKSQPPALPANLNIAPFKLSAPTRSSSRAAAIAIPAQTDYVALQLELEPDDYPAYRAALLTQPDRKPAGWNREKLNSRAAGETKVIDISLPASLLKSREYILEVTGLSRSGEAGDSRYYTFRVTKQ